MNTALLLVPVLSALVLLPVRRKVLTRVLLIGNAAFYLLYALVPVLGRPWPAPFFLLNGYFSLDDIGFYFLLILSLVFAASALYSLTYFKEHGLDSRQESIYGAAMLLFLAAMTGAILSAHLALLWVFVEATTLTSAVLIYFERKKTSLEATWKYIYICSVGIALAFVGIIVLSVGSKALGSLFFADLYTYAPQINPFWLKIAFAFILVGFGTKIGIAPMHAWLPDAHSEAPSPVSALLSGTLLNTALLALVRIYEIMTRAGLSSFARFLLLLTGFLSILVSAAFMLRLVNYKRMLAYSSIENMGIILLGIGAGGGGIFAALLHSAAHSLSKASLFLTSGNILHLHHSKEIKDVRGLLKTDPRTGWVWLISVLAISGFPPFPAFMSKFLLIKAFFEAGLSGYVVPLFLLLVIILAGMGGAAFDMAFGQPPVPSGPPVKQAALRYLPQAALLLVLLLVGVHLPAKVLDLLQQAALFLR